MRTQFDGIRTLLHTRMLGTSPDFTAAYAVERPIPSSRATSSTETVGWVDSRLIASSSSIVIPSMIRLFLPFPHRG